MIELPGYWIEDTLHNGSIVIVYRGVREKDDQPVVLKQLNRKFPTSDELEQFQREHDIISSFDSELIVRVFGIEKYGNTRVMVMEDFGGESLDRLLPEWRFDLEEFIRLSIRISAAVSVIHQNQISHKDIHPGNIIWNREAELVKITDFGIASKMGEEGHEKAAPGELEGMLAYISPEQTGRMNRSVDYRTDFYSLGVVLYRIAAGRLPFASDDPASLVHSHIARTPALPSEYNPAIPPVISGIIMKCLAKSAEERYQSGFALVADLRECLDRLLTDGRIDPFEPGKHDKSRMFQVPGTICGRDPEVEDIIHAWQRVSAGAKEMLLVAGNPGVGKTAIVTEARKSIIGDDVYFICGKFNRLEQSTPYSALMEAFRDLAMQITAGGSEKIDFWRTAVSTMGYNAQLLLEMIPELEIIVPRQEKLPDLAPVETQLRFNLMILSFIRIFSGKDHPLVVFLDDLQWADDASLKQLEWIMKDVETDRLLIIGTYRDTEVDLNHPLRSTVKNLRQADIPVKTWLLPPLNLPHVNRIIADTLSRDPEATYSLAEICFRKTRGNPLFLIQFLRNVAKDGGIYFDEFRSEWRWNLTEISQADIADDVVDLVMKTIGRLPGETRNVLLTASCIGMHFDADTLSLVHDTSAAETIGHLYKALEEGLVVWARDAYRFAHDRIHQAAYGMIHPEKKGRVHLEIGRRLYENTPKNELDDAVFRIVGQLNIAADRITDPGERLLLAGLNLRAGKRAKASGAFESAYACLEKGIALLPADSWEAAYELTHQLYTEAAETAFCCTSFDRMEELADTVITNARNLLDKVSSYDLKIQWYFANNDLLKVVDEGLRLLRLLGFHFPDKPKTAHVALKLLKTKVILACRRIDDLKKLEDMGEPKILAAIRIMRNLAHAAYGACPNLNPMLSFRTCLLSLKYGIAPETPTCFAGFAMVLCGILGDFENGSRYGELALHLNERSCVKRYRAQTAFLVISMVDHWKKPLHETLPPLFSTYKLGLELGDFEFATLSLFFYDAHSFFTGARLEELSVEMAAHSRTISQFRQDTHFYFNEMARQTVLNLMGRCEDSCRLTGEAYDEKGMLPVHIKNNDLSAVFMVNFYKMILNYLFGQNREALACSRTVRSCLINMVSTAWIPLFHFYDSLIRLSCIGEADSRSRRRHLKKVRSNQKKLKKWSKSAPMNLLHKWLLVEAERFRMGGNILKAMEYYENAVQAAGKPGFLQEEALANELAAKFWLSIQKPAFAEHYLLRALHCYKIWGASAKADDLQRRYPLLLPQPATVEKTGGLKSTTTSTLSAALDLEALLKALQALSGEIVFDELVRKMMMVVIESAGAQKALLLNRGKDGWITEAEGTVLKDTVETLVENRKADAQRVPLSIIHLCAFNKQTIVLNDATEDSRFGRDPYVENFRPKSVLCVPIFHRAVLTGILYLENRITLGAFTADRLKIVKILASQTAISLENARLYETSKASETKYRSIFENAIEGIFQVTPHGRFISANQAMADILGYNSPDDLIGGAEITETFSDDDSRLHFTRMLGSKGHITGFECAGTRRDSREFWSSISIRAVYGEEGAVRLYEGSLVDITERKAREKAEEDTRAAQAATEAKNEFLANMSHEIRTPMTAIMGLTDIMLQSGPTERQQEKLHQIKGVSRSLLRIIDDILDFSKIEAGKLNLEETEFKLSNIFTKISYLFAGTQAEKKIEMLFSVSTDIPDILIGDPLRIEQVLVNLVSNAFKFTQEGIVLIGARPLQQEGDRLQLQFFVEDTGIGIPEDAMAGLFDPFTQADGSITRKYGGTGLGLAISRKIVEMMKGRIWCERNDNPGSTFYFKIELGCRQDRERPPLKFPAAMTGKTVLVVDDNKVFLKLLARQLAGFGLRTETSSSGEQAVDSVSHPANNKKYDIILMDSGMPGMGGIEAVRRIRSALEEAAPPVIMMIDRFESDVLEPASGIAGILIKPVLPGPLFETVLAGLFHDACRTAPVMKQPQLPPEALQRLRGTNILLVEDNPISRMTIPELMESAGVHVDICENGEQAVAAVSLKNYDAVLMDIQMPGMDGYETTRAIRKDERFKNLLIIAMTAHAFEDHKKACLAAGMNDFIPKPIDIEALLVKLAGCVGEEDSCSRGETQLTG